MLLTETLLNEGKSDNGAWSKAQLECLGLSYPLVSGWKERIIGSEFDEEKIGEFLSLKNAHLKVLSDKQFVAAAHKLDMIRAIDPVERTRRELVEPYMQAFRFCLFWSASIAPVIDSSLEEEVAVFIDCKVRFYDRVQAYYDYWRSTDSMARRIPATPQMRPSVSYIPLQAADLIAGVLRDEADRRLYRPNDAPQASFGALLSMASKRLHRTLDEYAHLPFCMLLTEADSSHGRKT